MATMTRTRLPKILRDWLPFAIMGIALVILIYAGIQQDMRISANDPQIQLAEDGAAALVHGASAQSIANPQPVDSAASLATFVIVTDDSQKLLAGSVTIQGEPSLLPPAGSFDAAKSLKDNRFTWQPATGVRIATVIKHFGGDHPGYIVVGRSLREVEERESRLTQMAGLDLLGLLVGTFLILLVTVE